MRGRNNDCRLLLVPFICRISEEVGRRVGSVDELLVAQKSSKDSTGWGASGDFGGGGGMGHKAWAMWRGIAW